MLLSMTMCFWWVEIIPDDALAGTTSASGNPGTSYDTTKQCFCHNTAPANAQVAPAIAQVTLHSAADHLLVTGTKRHAHKGSSLFQQL